MSRFPIVLSLAGCSSVLLAPEGDVDPEVALPRETGRDSDTDNDGVLSFLDSAAPAPDGSRVIVAGSKANVVAGLARTGRRLTSQTTARAALVEVGLGARGEAGYDSLRRSLDDLDYVSALVFSPMGETLYALIEGAEAIIALDAFTFDSAGSIDDIGHGADGLALDATGTLLFVHAALSREVRIYDVRDLSTEPIALGRIPTVDVEPLAPDVLAGAIVFHRSRDARRRSPGRRNRRATGPHQARRPPGKVPRSAATSRRDGRAGVSLLSGNLRVRKISVNPSR